MKLSSLRTRGYFPPNAMKMQPVICEVFLSRPAIPTHHRGTQHLERANVIKEEIQEQDTHYLAVYVEAKNSIMIMLSEREDRLGTMAIAVPKPRDVIGSVSSSIIMGDRNVITARMFAEYVAAKKGKIAMVSVYLDTMTEMEAQKVFQHLIDKVMKSGAQKEPAAT